MAPISPPILAAWSYRLVRLTASHTTEYENAPGHYGRGLFRVVGSLLCFITLFTEVAHVGDRVLHDEMVDRVQEALSCLTAVDNAG